MPETATIDTPATGEGPAGAPSATQSAPQADPGTTTPDTSQEGATGEEDARVKRANAEAAKYRVQLREAQEAQQKTLDAIAKALGLKDDDAQPDPAALAAQIGEKDATIRRLTQENALAAALHEIGAKPVARAAILGDGVLDTLDPAADDYRAQVAKAVAAYVEKNDLKAGQAPAKSGTQHPGGTGGRSKTPPSLDDAVARAFGA